MVFHSQQDLCMKDQYQVKMITKNNLQNFLKCHLQIIDNHLKFYYEITSRQPLDRCYENDNIGHMELEHMLLCLKGAFDAAEEHLLFMDDMVMNPQYIYMDVETYEVFFCYLPGYGKPIQESFHELAEYILNRLDHKDKAAVHRGYELYRLSMKENYSMEEILQIGFQHIEEGERGYEEDIERINLDQEQSDLYKPFKEEREKNQEGYLENKAFLKEEDHFVIHKEKETENKGKKKKLRIGLGLLSVFIVVMGMLYGVGFSFRSQDMVLNYGQWMKILGGAVTFIGIMIYATIGDRKMRKKNTTVEKTNSTKGTKMKDSVSLFCKGLKLRLKMINKKSQEGFQLVPDRSIHTDLEEDRREEVDIYNKNEKEEQMDYGMTTFLNAHDQNKSPCLFSVQPDLYPDILLNKDSITIGKKATLVDVVIDHPLISRIHAKVIREGEDYYLLDLNSTNGTYLNGELFYGNQKHLLHDFDEIIFANIMYHYGTV